jgi:hypothetical protein
MLPSCSIAWWLAAISWLITWWKRICSDGTSRSSASSSTRGTTQTCESSSATRVDLVDAGVDAAEADQLAGHLEASDLLFALMRAHEGLEESRQHGEERVGAVAGAKQRSAARDLALRDDETMLDALKLFARQPDRKADLAQVAARAVHLALGRVQRTEWAGAEAAMGRAHRRHCMRGTRVLP